MRHSVVIEITEIRLLDSSTERIEVMEIWMQWKGLRRAVSVSQIMFDKTEVQS
jgi:hypothetical protein